MRVDAATVRTLDDLEAALVRRNGPRVIVAKVTESRPTIKPPLDYVGIKERFMNALAAG